MHTVIRSYSGSGAGEVIDFIIASKSDVKKMMHSVKGFVSYSVVKTEDGGFTVTVTKTEKAADAITAAAREWVLSNAKHIKAKAPKIVGGKVSLSISEKPTPKAKA
jgi:hypothetical protein